MNKIIKLIFSMMIYIAIIFFFWSALITGNPFYTFKYIKFHHEVITYEQTQHFSCHITATEPTIILRIDDVRAYSQQTIPMVDEVINRNLSATLGVIPKDIEKDKVILDYLNSIKSNPNIEISQHGINHDETDADVNEEELIKANEKLQREIGIKPVTYCIPYNLAEIPKKTLAKYFNILSGEKDIIKEGEDYAEIGFTSQYYDHPNGWYNSVDSIISECNKNLEKTNLCVVLLHPQEISSNLSNPTDISEKKFNNFKLMLDDLQDLNANFSTFKDIVYCQEV